MMLNIDIMSEIVNQIYLIKDQYKLITLIIMKHVSKDIRKLIKIKPKYLEMKNIFYKLTNDGNLKLIKTFIELGFEIICDKIPEKAASSGTFEILKWAWEKGYTTLAKKRGSTFYY